VNFRSLAEYGRFAKWQFVEASWKPAKDHRPESRHVHQDSIEAGETIGTGARGWRLRRQWLDPLVDESLHTLDEDRQRTGKSLGVIRPRRIKSLIIRDAETWDAASQADLVQLSIAWTNSPAPSGSLEQLPYDFVYAFSCADDRCRGHEMKVLDWEMAQTFRNFRQRYGAAGWESKFRQKYFDWLLTRDVHFVVGTHHVFGNWLLVGVLYPPHIEVDEGNRRSRRKVSGEQGSMALPGFGLEAQEGNRLLAD